MTAEQYQAAHAQLEKARLLHDQIQQWRDAGSAMVEQCLVGNVAKGVSVLAAALGLPYDEHAAIRGAVAILIQDRIAALEAAFAEL